MVDGLYDVHDLNDLYDFDGDLSEVWSILTTQRNKQIHGDAYREKNKWINMG